MSRSSLFSLRAATVAAVLVAMTAGVADASFISNSPDPLLGGIRVPMSGVPVATEWGYATYTVTNIAETSNIVSGGDNIIDYTYNENFTFYTSPSLTTVATRSTLLGSYELTIAGRTSPFETGNFNFTYTATATGTVDGDSVVISTNPAQLGTGTTSITPGPGSGQYTIDTRTFIAQEYRVNGGTPIMAPLVGATSVPEPSSILSALTAGAVLGAAGLIRRPRRA